MKNNNYLIIKLTLNDILFGLKYQENCTPKLTAF